MAHNYILSIGSNVSAGNVEDAVDWLRELLDDFRMSHIYETPAVKSGTVSDDRLMACPELRDVGGKTEKPLIRYNNAVVAGSSVFHLEALIRLLKSYEKKCGRDDSARAECRVPIDIDVVICNGEVVRPWDYRQQFFRIGLSELAGSPV